MNPHLRIGLAMTGYKYKRILHASLEFNKCTYNTVGVCVDDGWFKQAVGSLIGSLGWVRLHTCCRLMSNQCVQVQPTISTHSQENSSMAVEHPCHVHYHPLQQTGFNTTTLSPLFWRSLEKSHRWTVAATWCVVMDSATHNVQIKQYKLS